MQRLLNRVYVVHRYLLLVTKRLTEKQLMMILAAVVGLVAGFGTYVFESLLHFIKNTLVSWFAIDSASFLYLVYPAIGIILASLFVKYIVKDNISEGVTRVLYAMSKRGSRIKSHNCYTSIVGGAITIGFGGSVGPEAPIVLTGSAIGSNTAKFMRLNYRNTTLLLCCGAAAALAAIFKAPITGVIFVLEILMLDITMRSIIPLIISSVSATALVFFLHGFDPILNIQITSFELGNLPIYFVLAIFCGFLSFYFKSVNGRIAESFEKMKSPYKKWLFGGLILGVLIFIFPPLYGEGYEGFTDLMNSEVSSLFNNSLFYNFRDIPWVVILYVLAILFFKVVATASTNAAGGVGGTFAPSLFVGAFAGAVTALIGNYLFDLNLPLSNFTLVGMAGVMAGVMNAPLTSIFLIAELSNGYALFVPLMLVASTSFAIGYYFDPHSIYTKKLYQKGQLLTHDKDKSVLVFLDLNKLMETNFSVLSPTDTLGDVVALISKSNRNVFPVVLDGLLLGVVQLDDLRAVMFATDKYHFKIDNFMIPPPEKILVNEQISSVMKSFDDSGAWMLPVVDSQGNYQGFISKTRILSAYRAKLMEMTEE